MWPILAVRVGSLIPRVEAVAASAGPTLATAAARIRAMGVNVGSKADELIAWAKTNPMNASILALTLGSLGIEVADLFESDEGKKTAAKVTTGQAALVDYAKILQAGQSSEKMDLQVSEVANDLHTARAVLSYAKSHYGSRDAAINAHKMHQAFFEMPLSDVLSGYDNLRT